jgi:hypothetical protein
MFDDEDAIVSHTTLPTAPGWYVTTLGDGELSDLPIVAWEVERYECTKGRYRGNVDRTVVPILLDNNFNLDRGAWLIRDPSAASRRLHRSHQRSVSRPWDLGALFHFSGLGPALRCSSHSQYNPATPTMPAARTTQPSRVGVRR